MACKGVGAGKKFPLSLFLILGWAFCAPPPPAPAAAVNYDYPQSSSYVVGNPVNAGDASGIGGTGGTPANNANSSGNTVNIAGGTINTGIYGGYHSTSDAAAARAGGNEVNVGAAFAGNAGLYIYGGFARVRKTSGSAGKSAVASGNAVHVDGGRAFQILGGQAVSDDGPASADNNTVTLRGGEVTTIYAGAVNAAGAYAASASGNRVVISGGAVSGAVYGGYIASGAGNKATNNTVTLTGAPNLVKAGIYGGYSYSSLDDSFSGNTLEVKRPGITVRSLSAFQYFSFYIPASASVQDAWLNVVETANIAESTVSVGMDGGNPPLQVGDTITLIRAKTLSGTPAGAAGRGVQGISRAYAFRIDADNSAGTLLATVFRVDEPGGGDGGDGGSDGDDGGDGGSDGDGGDDGGGSDVPQLEAQLKTLPESRLAGLALLIHGQDLLEARAMQQLRSLAPHTPGPAAFGVIGGKNMRYKSGSHIDVESLNLIAGLGWRTALDESANGDLLLGAFFEAGFGSYNSQVSFGSLAAVKGDGDVRYYGGGLLARYETAPLTLAGLAGTLYLEASARAGRADTSCDSSDFLTASGNAVRFDSAAAYYGAHAGLGYLWSISELSSLDLYAKYLWTRQESDSVTIEGDRITFHNLESRRWRAGTRFARSLRAGSGSVAPYVGLAYEYEFDSRARADCNGYAIAAPDVKGGTGVGELGLTVRPPASGGFSLDLGLQGYTGKREGYGGSLRMTWNF